MSEAPRNADLEAAILEAPESPDAYLVYGDWLLEQGDPLGELVTVQATLVKLAQRAGNAKEKRALGKREKSLLEEAEARLGPLAAHEHTWSFGFLESLILARPGAAEYERVLADPAARFLRELDIDDLPRAAPSAEVHSTIALLVRVGVPSALRKLALLSDSARGIDLGRLPPALWPRLASVEELTVRAARVDPGYIAMPRLRTLSLAASMTDALLDALAGATCPRLASLQLDATGEPKLTASRVRPLLTTWAKQGTLRHLGLTEHDDGNAILAALLATGLAKQLTSLDLSRAAITDSGGKTILASPEAFEHLTSFALAENDLSPAMTRRLEERFELVVDLEDQGTRFDAEDD